jgi:hypothetical protein
LGSIDTSGKLRMGKIPMGLVIIVLMSMVLCTCYIDNGIG